MPTQITDGEILLDSFPADIDSNGTVTYVFTGVTVTPAVLTAERNDEHGRLAAVRTMDDPGRDTATGTLQIPTATHNVKVRGLSFIIPSTHHYDGIATTYMIQTETQTTNENESFSRGFTARRILTQP